MLRKSEDLPRLFFIIEVVKSKETQ